MRRYFRPSDSVRNEMNLRVPFWPYWNSRITRGVTARARQGWDVGSRSRRSNILQSASRDRRVNSSRGINGDATPPCERDFEKPTILSMRINAGKVFVPSGVKHDAKRRSRKQKRVFSARIESNLRAESTFIFLQAERVIWWSSLRGGNCRDSLRCAPRLCYRSVNVSRTAAVFTNERTRRY